MKPTDIAKICFTLFLFTVPMVYASQWEADIAKGLVPGHRVITIRSHSHVIGAAEQIIWCETVDYVFPPVPTLMNVSSSDVDDVLGGAGLWNVTVFGLDANWVEQVEVVSMNGQNPVSTVNQYIRINSLHGNSGGGSEANEGDVYIGVGPTVAGVPATIYSVVCVGEGNSLIGLYSIPANHTGYLLTGRCGTADNKVVAFSMYHRGNAYPNRAWKATRHLHVDQQFVYIDAVASRFPRQADIILKTEAATSDTHVNFNVKLLLVEDGFDVVQDTVQSTNNMLLYMVLVILVILAVGTGMRRNR